jgi:hypothetical protein
MVCALRIVQFDKGSPFFELVNITEKSNPNKIGYRSMVRLARVWYQGKHPAIQQLLQGLYSDISGPKGTKKRIVRWQFADWGIFFKDFWSSAAKTYSDVKGDETQMSLWTPGHSNLLIGVVLEELQEAFLDHLAQQDVDLFFTPTDKKQRSLRTPGPSREALGFVLRLGAGRILRFEVGTEESQHRSWPKGPQ